MLLSDPGTFRAGGPNQNTSLESSIKKFKSHLIYDWGFQPDLNFFVLVSAYLFINDGHGRFTEEARERGLALDLGRKLYGTAPLATIVKPF